MGIAFCLRGKRVTLNPKTLRWATLYLFGLVFLVGGFIFARELHLIGVGFFGAGLVGIALDTAFTKADGKE